MRITLYDITIVHTSIFLLVVVVVEYWHWNFYGNVGGWWWWWRLTILILLLFLLLCFSFVFDDFCVNNLDAFLPMTMMLNIWWWWWWCNFLYPCAFFNHSPYCLPFFFSLLLSTSFVFLFFSSLRCHLDYKSSWTVPIRRWRWIFWLMGVMVFCLEMGGWCFALDNVDVAPYLFVLSLMWLIGGLNGAPCHRCHLTVLLFFRICCCQYYCFIHDNEHEDGMMMFSFGGRCWCRPLSSYFYLCFPGGGLNSSLIQIALPTMFW